MTPEEISALISAHLPGSKVSVASEDNTHFSATVVSDAFEGLRPLGRHRIVYEALGPRMGREIHALSLSTHTPGEWARLPGQGKESPRG
ncbi:MAG: BolA/IbaG family iron-sulfur metabolism protein [Gammaproteobacteria bacterium]|nr:BolA/IbaG family iron-sulfur metabolism protein [Gammaproteobacteria bacterium]